MSLQDTTSVIILPVKRQHRCAAQITGIARNCVWFPSDLCTQQRRYLTARISVLFMCNNAVVTSVTKCAVIATSSSSAAAAAAAAVLVLVVVELLGDWRSCSCGSWKSCHLVCRQFSRRISEIRRFVTTPAVSFFIVWRDELTTSPVLLSRYIADYENSRVDDT